MTHLWACISMDSTSSLGGMFLLHEMYHLPLNPIAFSLTPFVHAPFISFIYFSSMPIPRSARDRQLRFQLDSGREHPPRVMSSSEPGHCYGGLDVS